MQGELSPIANAAPQGAGDVLTSIIVPIYNEQATLARVVDRLQQLPFSTELLLVDDGSSDRSSDILASLEGPRVRVFRHARNRGKGAAIRTALAAARGDFVVIQDADEEYDPAQLEALLQPLIAGDAEVCYGTRFAPGSTAECPVLSRWANRWLTRLSNLCTGLELTDMETCYKAFCRRHVQDLPLRENRFGFEPEVTAKLARRGLRFVEAPIRYTARSYAEGKQIGLRDAFAAMWCIFRYALRD